MNGRARICRAERKMLPPFPYLLEVSSFIGKRGLVDPDPDPIWSGRTVAKQRCLADALLPHERFEGLRQENVLLAFERNAARDDARPEPGQT